jgi:hypothetical protein
MTTRRDLLVDSVLLVSAVAVNLFVAPGVRWPFRLLALFGLLVCLRQLASTLRKLDDAKHGTFDLIVACDHNPEGVRHEQLSRSRLWLLLRFLDPDHHLVWINGQPFDPDDWRRHLKGKRR